MEEKRSRAKRLKIVRGMTTLSTKAIGKKYSYLNEVTFRGWESCRHGGLTEKGAKKVIDMLEQEKVKCSIEWLLFGTGEWPKFDVEIKH